jgi:N6-adenosine-specific RNA methylase IME4
MSVSVGDAVWVYWLAYANEAGNDRWIAASVEAVRPGSVLCRYGDGSTVWSACGCVRARQRAERRAKRPRRPLTAVELGDDDIDDRVLRDDDDEDDSDAAGAATASAAGAADASVADEDDSGGSECEEDDEQLLLDADDRVFASVCRLTDAELEIERRVACAAALGRRTVAQEVYERMAQRFPGGVRVFELAAARVPAHCVPVCADVRTLDWNALVAASGGQFDAIMMDPPWKLAGAQPTRGVAIGYSQLSDVAIEQLPVQMLAREGFLFMWVINSKYAAGIRLMQKWGYRLVDDIAWVKETVNRRLAKSHGYYLQHAKETCLVGVKGAPAAAMALNSDVIFAGRRGQSQKPDAIYEWVEALVPHGQYLEIFARRNNLRNGWVSIGNEL